MAFSGGTFSRTFDCTTDRDNGVKILASKFDTELDGFATGLSTCILKDGTQTCTAAIPFAEGLTVPDNKTIVLGTNSDITIQYDESTNDSLEIAANVEGAALGIVLKADQGDDNADQHKLNIADGGVLTLGSKISGSFVSYLTHTPNSTVASSTTAVAGNLTVGGDLTLGSGAVISEAELEAIDGVTAGTVTASKAVIVDSNKDIASFRNVTLTGELDAGSLDISGDADIDGTLEADAMTLNGTAITATATLDTGISNNNVPKFTSGVTDDDFLRVAGTAIEGRSASEVLSDIAAMPLAGGAFSGDVTFTGDNYNIVFDKSDDALEFSDNAKATFGAGSDLELSHNGTNSIIESKTGDLILRTAGTESIFLQDAGGNNLAQFNDNSDVKLYHNANEKLATTSSGVDITGGFTATDGCTITTSDNTAQLTLKSTDADSSVGPVLDLIRDSASPADGDSIGQIKHTADNDAGEATTYASSFVTLRDASDGVEDGQVINYVMTNGSLVDHLRMGRGSAGGQSEVVINEGSADIDFRVESDGNANMLFVDAGNDRVGIGKTPTYTLDINGVTAIKDGESLTWQGNAQLSSAIVGSGSNARLQFWTSANERMRIDSSGNFLVGKTSAGIGVDGVRLTSAAGNANNFTISSGTVMQINRNGDDGSLINFMQAGSSEGNISVSGSTVSYNGGHLSRWSQATDGNRIDGLVKGTVMTNLDQMAEWTKDGVTEDNEQLNCMAVSSVEGDPNVAGVFVNWDDDDEDYTADMNVAMTGDMVIRIAKDTTVARGDLLMSAGDGTAKPQGDDIVRSKTIAKVTSITVSHTYDDGTYLVPCVLMAC